MKKQLNEKDQRILELIDKEIQETKRDYEKSEFKGYWSGFMAALKTIHFVVSYELYHR